MGLVGGVDLRVLYSDNIVQFGDDVSRIIICGK